MDDKIALVGRSRGCVIVNTSWCSWINALGQVERLIQNLRDKATRLSEVDPDVLWDFFSLFRGGALRNMVEINSEGWPHPTAC